MIAICKTRTGTWIGKVSYTTEPPESLTDPALIDFLTVPVQGPLGQPSFSVITSVILWPTPTVLFTKQPDVYCFISEDSSEQVVKQYLQTIADRKKNTPAMIHLSGKA